MLSLSKGDPIAEVTPKKGKPFKICIFGAQDMHIDKTKPHLKVENEHDLLDKEFMKLYRIKDRDLLLQQLKDGVENEETEAALAHIDLMLRKRITLPDDAVVFPIPQVYSERGYVSAPSGAGKSYFTGQYVEKIRDKFGKKRQVFIFSRVEADEALDKFGKKVTVRVPLQADLWNSVTFTPEDFKEGICIFDDIDMLQDKTLKQKVQALRQNILETGRHVKCSCLSTSHQLQNFNETRVLINEAMWVVLFPKASSIYHVHSFLEKYMGLKTQMIRYLYSLPTRWLYISKFYPRYIVHQHGVILL